MSAIDCVSLMTAAQAKHLDELAAKDAVIAAKDAEIAKLKAKKAKKAKKDGPKRQSPLGTLAWMAYVNHIKTTQSHHFLNVATELEKLTIIREIRADDPEGYQAFVDAWKKENVALAPVAASVPEAAAVTEVSPQEGETEDEPTTQPVARPKSKGYVRPLIWWAYVRAKREKYAEEFKGMPMSDQVSLIAQMKKLWPDRYAAFGEAWKKEHPGEGLEPMTNDESHAARKVYAERSRQKAKAAKAARQAASVGGGSNSQ